MWPGTCWRGRRPQTQQWGRFGGTLGTPLRCPLWDGACTSLPGTPKAGGESGRFSASGTHTIICNGFARGRPRLNWDFSWPATVELFLRYWAACVSWQGEVTSFFLSAFYPAFASSLIRVTKERQELGTTFSKLQQAAQGRKFLKKRTEQQQQQENQTKTTTNANLDLKGGEGKPFHLCSTVVKHFPPVPCKTSAFFHPSFLLKALSSQHNYPQQALFRLDNEEQLTTLVYPLHFLSHFTSVLEKVAPNGKS